MEKFKTTEYTSNPSTKSEVILKGIEAALKSEQNELDDLYDPSFLIIKNCNDNLYKSPETMNESDIYWQMVKEKEKIEEIAKKSDIGNPSNANLLLSFIKKRIDKEHERQPRLIDRINKQTAEYEKLMITVKQLEKSIRINKEHLQESNINLEIFNKTIKTIESNTKSITIEENNNPEEMVLPNQDNSLSHNSFTLEELNLNLKENNPEITCHIKEMLRNSRKGWTIFFPNKEQMIFFTRFIESKEKYLSNLKELIKELPKLGFCTDLYNAALYRQGMKEAQTGNMIVAYSYWKKMAFEFEDVEKMEAVVSKIEAEYFID